MAETIHLASARELDIEKTFECGQCFRWNADENGVYRGTAFGYPAQVWTEDGEVYLCSDAPEKMWREYFDLDRDYAGISAGFHGGEYLDACIAYGQGIRILRQEPWEALCSFIISQNNNIPRIKGIIERLCSSFGEQIGESDFSFPSCERLAALSEEELAPLRAGFRNKYILDAARKVSCGEVDFEKIKAAPFDEARQELLKIKGVGEKVAQCTLLYGFGRMEAFPVDVWVKRILSELYPDGFPQCAKGVEGIAQQYLFHWRRNLN